MLVYGCHRPEYNASSLFLQFFYLLAALALRSSVIPISFSLRCSAMATLGSISFIVILSLAFGTADALLLEPGIEINLLVQILERDILL